MPATILKVDLYARRSCLKRSATAEAVRWGKRGVRINTISPGIVMTPLARDELAGPRGAGYRRMIQQSAAGRAGTPDELAAVGALLMGPEGGFITGSDIDVAEVRAQK
jgi:NAD(P)-dependent dehydrogenase (short-subunit alcohol dehydrogenase family)